MRLTSLFVDAAVLRARRTGFIYPNYPIQFFKAGRLTIAFNNLLMRNSSFFPRPLYTNRVVLHSPLTLFETRCGHVEVTDWGLLFDHLHIQLQDIQAEDFFV